MHAHTPPFTAKTAKQVYDETSAIAATEDAKHAMTADEREAKLRTVAHYIYHAKLLMDEVFAESRARSCELLAECAREAQTMGLYADADIPGKSPHAGELDIDWNACFPTRAQLAEQGTSAEVAYLRKCGIGDVAVSATTVASQHPAHAEAIRIHDERLNGPEDHL